MIKSLSNLFRLLIIAFSFFIFSINKVSAVNFKWTGAVSSDWNIAGNWSPASVPGISDMTTIDGAAINMPMLTSDVTISGLYVGFNNCGSGTFTTVNLFMNNYKLTVGYVISPTSATGVFLVQSCVINSIANTTTGVTFNLTCTSACNNSMFIVNGSVNGNHDSDQMNSNVDVAFNFYEYGIMGFQMKNMDKNLTFCGMSSTNACSVFDGLAFSALYAIYPPYDVNTAQMVYYRDRYITTLLGNFTVVNRSAKVLSLGWGGLKIYGNLYLSNTGGGAIRTNERSRQGLTRVMPGGIITIAPFETLPQFGDIRLMAINQVGSAPGSGLIIDITTCPAGCSMAPTGNAMLGITSSTFSGAVFIKTPSMHFRGLRSVGAGFLFDKGYVNNQFLSDFNFIKTGTANDYFVGSNIFMADVNITNTGSGSINFGTNSSAALECNLAICASCSGNITGAVGNPFYDAIQAGDTVRGNMNVFQSCGAGKVNLMVSNKTNVYYKDVDFKISSNMSVSGTMSFNGSADQAFITEDFCSNNAIMTTNKIRMFQSSSLLGLNLSYISTLSGHQKLQVIDSSTVLTLGKINTGLVVAQLNGAYNAHIGSPSSYYVVNTIGGVRRVIPTSSATGYLFPTGTSSFYFPLSITGASVSAPITVGMISGVNSLYTGSPAFIPSGTVVGNLFINGVWAVNTTATGLKAMLRGGWWDNSATLPSFDPTISARMITNDGNGWSCFAGTANGVSLGTNPSWAYDYSVQGYSTIPGIYSVVTDGVTGGPAQNLCGPLITLAGLNATAINSGAWSVISAPSAVTFVSSTTGVTTVMGLNATGTYALLWSSSSYCGLSASAPFNIYKTGSGTVSGFWQGNSQDWFACKNWDNGIIPTATTDVTIPGGKLFYPNSSISGFSDITTLISINDLTLQNGSSMILTTATGNQLQINGNLNVQTGSVLSVSSNNFVIMAGSSALSTITGGGTILLSNLRINKTSGDVLLDRGLSLQSGTGILDLVKGVLRSYETTSTGPNVLVMNPGNTVTSVSDASYVDGWVRKVGNTPFVFPTGSSNGYKAIEISAPSSITDHFTAKYYAVDPTSYWDKNSKDVTLHHVSRMEYWILDRTGGTSSADVTLYWNLFSDVSYNAADYSAMRVSKWDGANWIDLGNAATYPSADRNYGWVKASTSATSFSPFTLATTIPANPLPLGLLSFNVSSVNQSAKFNWTLSDVKDIASFEVERSATASNFKKILNVSKINDHLDYSTTDLNPLNGLSYYRLKIVSKTGEVNYSQIVNYQLNMNDGLVDNISPNPFISNLNVILTHEQEDLNIILNDVMGQQVFNKNYENKKEIGLELGYLPDGIYHLTIKTNTTIFNSKIVKN